jgi:hypothetical protein
VDGASSSTAVQNHISPDMLSDSTNLPPALNSFNKRDRSPSFGHDYASDELESEPPVQNHSKQSSAQLSSSKKRQFRYIFQRKIFDKVDPACI